MAAFGVVPDLDRLAAFGQTCDVTALPLPDCILLCGAAGSLGVPRLHPILLAGSFVGFDFGRGPNVGTEIGVHFKSCFAQGGQYAATVERATSINARATKRGFTGRIEVTGSTREVTETDQARLKRTHLVVDTEITGEAPCYNGWTFLAAVDTVETADGADFVIRSAPGVEESVVDRSALEAGRYQHC